MTTHVSEAKASLNRAYSRQWQTRNHEWKKEYTDLKAQRDTDYAKLKATRAEVAELQKIRKCVDIALKAEQPEQAQTHTKRHELDR